MIVLSTVGTFSRHTLGGDGLWLIAVGAILLMVQVVMAGPQTGLSGRWVGPHSKPLDRAVYAIAAAGATLVAFGSILVAIASFPRWYVWAITAIGAILIACVAYRRNRPP